MKKTTDFNRPGTFFIVVLLACSIALSLAMISQAAAEQQSEKETTTNSGSPRIIFDRPSLVYDLGVIQRNGSGKIVIGFKNEGNATLEIESVKPSCGCTSVLLTSKTKSIPPGEEGKIETSLHVGGATGQFRKTVTVTSNDPNNSSTILTLTAKIESDLDLDPPFINFGTISPDKIGSKRDVMITGKDLDKLVIGRVEPSESYLSAISLPPESGKKNTRISVTLTALPPSQGAFNSTIMIHTNRITVPILSLKVNGFYSGTVIVTPDRISFSVTEKAPHPTRTVMVSNPRNPDFSVVGGNVIDKPLTTKRRSSGKDFQVIDPSPKDLEITIGTKNPDGTIPVTLTSARELKPGQRITGKYRILTNDPGQKEAELHYYIFSTPTEKK